MAVSFWKAEQLPRQLGARVPTDLIREPKVLEFAAARLVEDANYLPWSVRALILKATAEMIGRLRFNTLPDPDYLKPYAHDAIEFGCVIFPAHRRRGYAFEAVIGAMDWGKRRGVRNFIVTVSPVNAPSLGLLPRVSQDRRAHRRSGRIGNYSPERRDVLTSARGTQRVLHLAARGGQITGLGVTLRCVGAGSLDRSIDQGAQQHFRRLTNTQRLEQELTVIGPSHLRSRRRCRYRPQSWLSNSSRVRDGQIDVCRLPIFEVLDFDLAPHIKPQPSEAVVDCFGPATLPFSRDRFDQRGEVSVCQCRYIEHGKTAFLIRRKSPSRRVGIAD